jgi:small-conductance mechanosensitive channel
VLPHLVYHDKVREWLLLRDRRVGTAAFEYGKYCSCILESGLRLLSTSVLNVKDLFVAERTYCVYLKSTGKFYRMRRGNRLPLLLCAAFFLLLLLPSQRTFASQTTVSQTTTLPDLPSATDTLQYLRQTIDWYQHLRVEEPLATSAADVTFLDDDRRYAKEVLKVSFDFARAVAKLLSTKVVHEGGGDQPSDTDSNSGLVNAAARADNDVRASEAEVESLKQKLQAAPANKRREIQSTLDEVESELNLNRTRRDTLRSIVQFIGTSGAAGTDLVGQIDELQRSIPEVQTDTAKAAGTQVNAPGTSSAPFVQTVTGTQPSGILDLATNLFALSRKMHILDESIATTAALAHSAQQLRSPLMKSLRALAGRGEELAKAADTSTPAQLEQEKHELDSLTSQFKDFSSVIVPLQQQSILLGLYTNSLNRWKSSIQSEYSVELRSLLVRVGVLGFALAVVFVLAEIWRKATLRYIRDARRRYQFLLLRRIVLWCAVGITVAFALATEIGSLATFAGLITAGIAVALQNVILAIAGYFFIVGKYGVRVGDRVQISGVTGNVVDIGLIRLHLMELAGPGTDRQPTGRVVVFSNSIVFQPSASFFKQIPGTNFGWHEVHLILSPDSDYHMAEERMLNAVQSVYAKYRSKIEEQYRHMEQTFALGVEVPEPKSRLRLTQTGLEVVIQYPLDLERSAEIDDQIIRELLTALEKPPKLKLVGSGTPNIQPVLDRAAS